MWIKQRLLSKDLSTLALFLQGKSLFAVFPDFNVLVIGWGWCFHSETQFLLFRHFQLANAFLDRKSLMYLHA